MVVILQQNKWASRIRNGGPDDLEFLKTGLMNVRRIEKRPEEDIPITEDDVKSFENGISNGNIRVIDTDGGVPAAFLYYRTDFPIHYVHGRFLWIDLLFVMEEYRGQGMGSALYEDAMEIADRKGLDRIIIDIFDANKRSIIFHERRDFKPFYTIYIKSLREGR
jgi:GNAT superfamily N-acetyltransferase